MQVLVLARVQGARAVYGVLVDASSTPGTILGVTEALSHAAHRRRFLAGALPADSTRVAWGQRQRWAFPLLAFGAAPIVQHAAAATPPIPATATYRHEVVHCGKPTCSRCRAGPGHGPYWYAYWRANGRLRKRYLGKTFVPPPTANTTQSLPDSYVMNNPG